MVWAIGATVAPVLCLLFQYVLSAELEIVYIQPLSGIQLSNDDTYCHYPENAVYNVTFSWGQVTLQLHRYDVITEPGRSAELVYSNLMIVKPKTKCERKVVIYTDFDEKTAITLKCDSTNPSCILTGSILIEGRRWTINPVEEEPYKYHAVRTKESPFRIEDLVHEGKIWLHKSKAPLTNLIPYHSLNRDNGGRFRRDTHNRHRRSVVMTDCNIFEVVVVSDALVWQYFVARNGGNVTEAEADLREHYEAQYREVDLILSCLPEELCLRVFLLDVLIQKNESTDWTTLTSGFVNGVTGMATCNNLLFGGADGIFCTTRNQVELVGFTDNLAAVANTNVTCGNGTARSALYEDLHDGITRIIALIIAAQIRSDLLFCTDNTFNVDDGTSVPTDEEDFPLLFMFSQCAQDILADAIDDLDNGSNNCLRIGNITDDQFEEFANQSLLAGEIVDLDHQCQLAFGVDSLSCELIDPMTNTTIENTGLCGPGAYCTSTGTCGAENRTLVYSGTFCGPNEICFKGLCNDSFACGAPPVVPGGYYFLTTGTARIGAMATLLCNEGFQTSSTVTISCRSTGWSAGSENCTIRECENLPQDENGEFVQGITNTVGTIATLCCHDHFVPSTKFTSVVCQPDGNYSTPQAVCIRDCGIPPRVDNGYYELDSNYTLLNSTASLICCKGFYKSENNSQITCQAGGWTGIATCSVVMFEKLDTLFLPFTYDPVTFGLGEDAAVQMAYDPPAEILYSVGNTNIHVIDLSDSNYNLTVLYRVSIDNVSVTDVEVCGNFLFVSFDNETDRTQGFVNVYETYNRTENNLTLIQTIIVGVQPDMILPTSDCSRVFVAVEAEPFIDSSMDVVDLPGGVGIITFNTTPADSFTFSLLTFAAFNSQLAELEESGVRYVFMENNTFSDDLEPEYIAFNPDETRAYFSLQENNAIVTVDMVNEIILNISGLGFKDWSQNSLDPSDRDGGINFNSWSVFGMYQPDSIQVLTINGENYILTANEGEAKSIHGFSEQTRVGNEILSSAFGPNSTVLQMDENLGRLVITNVTGVNETSGGFVQLLSFGARSFSIWRADTLEQVYDSGNEIAHRTASLRRFLFNSDFEPSALIGGNESVDTRSDNSGVETESIITAKVGHYTLIIIGNERPGIIAVYAIDTTLDTVLPKFQTLLTDIPEVNKTWQQVYDDRELSMLDPEDLLFISEEDSPQGEPLLVVSGEYSGTITVFRVKVESEKCEILPKDEYGVFVRSGGNSVGSIATLCCNHGYAPSSKFTSVVCRKGGNYSTPEAFCIPDCGIPPHVENGYYELDSDSTLLDSTASLKCCKGFYKSENNSQITCHARGWTGVATCSVVMFEKLDTLFLPFMYDPVTFGLGEDAAVQMAYDPPAEILYSVGNTNIHVIDLSDSNYNLTVLYRVSIDNVSVTDVEVCGNFLFVSFDNETDRTQGFVNVYETYNRTENNLTLIQTIIVGVQPDMILPTSDCSRVFVAVEAEPFIDSSMDVVDLPGGVGIIKFNTTPADSFTFSFLTFEAFNAQLAELEQSGVRYVFMENNTFSDNLEPEYIAFNPYETRAYFSLQENNAIVTVDMVAETILNISGLGFKNWSQNSLDPSDRDGGINFNSWPIFGMYQPDSIQVLTINGEDYILTANEGEAKSIYGFSEKTRVENEVLSSSFGPNSTVLQMDENLGRLVITNVTGVNETSGEFVQLLSFGARSFSIWRADTLEQVYDSGNEIAHRTASLRRFLFNSDFEPSALIGGNESVDTRSDNSGVETESIITAKVGHYTFIIIGNERPGIIAVYAIDTTLDTVQPKFQTLLTDIPEVNKTWQQVYDDRELSMLDPEDLLFISEEDSPQGEPLLVVSGEYSGTITVFRVKVEREKCETLPKDEYGVFVRSDGNNVGSIATLCCNHGYAPSSKFTSVVCKKGGNYSTPQAICIPDCGNPPRVENGYYELDSDSTLLDSTASLICCKGFYKSENNSQITCQASGWTGVATCSVVMFEKLDTLFLPFTYDPLTFGLGEDAAVQMAYDPPAEILYSVGNTNIHVIDLSDSNYNLSVLFRVSIDNVSVTDVEVCGNFLFVSFDNETDRTQGFVNVYETYTRTEDNLTLIQTIIVGVQPDMILPTSDCSRVFVAVEAEPFIDSSMDVVDLPGGIGIIKFNTTPADSFTFIFLTFEAFNSQLADLEQSGVRYVFMENNTFSDDLEPEYIAFNPDETRAYFTLQENNAIVTVDMVAETILNISGLGFKNWSQTSLDPSDRDGGINFNSWPVFGMYQPDSIQVLTINGEDYILTANEGEVKSINGFSEQTRVGNEILSSAFGSNTTVLQMDENLGRLVITNKTGVNETSGEFIQLLSFGARSFSIWRADTLEQVYDSGNEIAHRTASMRRFLFNSDFEPSALIGGNESVDTRSDDSGIETESIITAKVGHYTLIIIGNERPGIIAVYAIDTTLDTVLPKFQTLLTDIPEVDKTWQQVYDDRELSMLDPEDLLFISEEDSPQGEPLLVVSGEYSGTITVFRVKVESDKCETLPKDENGMFVLMDRNTVGSIATLCCNHGYAPSTKFTSVVCRKGGNYSTPQAVCIPDCGIPPQIENGYYVLDSNSTLLGATASQVCCKGFFKPMNNSQITCEVGGWIGIETCSVVMFEKLATLFLPLRLDPEVFRLGGDAAEQIAYDPYNQILYSVGNTNIHVIDMSDPSSNLTILFRVSIDNVGVTDVEVCGNFLFVSFDNETDRTQGFVNVYEKYNSTINNLTLIHSIVVGVLPDMILPTSDCSRVFVAVEAEPFIDSSMNVVDLPGGVGIIKFNTTPADSFTFSLLTFDAFNSSLAELEQTGVRYVYMVNNTFIDDLEPEYIAFNADETLAFFSLQENNAIATVDMVNETILNISGLGFKDWSQTSLDPSDRDGGINFNSWPVFGMYQPDAIQVLTINGEDYILTANEGGSKSIHGFNEETRVGDEVLSSTFEPNATVRSMLQMDENLGRLEITTKTGVNETTGEFIQLFSFGARSFSIWRADTLEQVYDSGNEIAHRVAALRPFLFNSNFNSRDLIGVIDSVDTRSDNSGVETESIITATVGHYTLIIIGNERPGIIAVYAIDTTSATIEPKFQTLLTDIPDTDDQTWGEVYDDRALSMLDPEDLLYIPANDSALGCPLLVVSGEYSGTITVFKINVDDKK